MNAPTLIADQARPEPARFSLPEFLDMKPALDRLEGRIELDHGTIIRRPPAYNPHTRLQRLIYRLLDAAPIAPGLLLFYELGVQVGDDAARAIDIAIAEDRPAEPQLLDARYVRLAVEVADSSLEYDLTSKAADYASSGIADYWVVDLHGKQTFCHRRPADGRYSEVERIGFGGPIGAMCLGAPITIEG